jgi:membrane associated rhomboid family serine protease
MIGHTNSKSCSMPCPNRADATSALPCPMPPRYALMQPCAIDDYDANIQGRLSNGDPSTSAFRKMSGAAIILTLTVATSIVGLFSRSFIGWAVLRPYLIARGSGYGALITSGFVHADVGHLLFNLITFYSFAFPLERTLGTGSFVALYFCGLLISGIGTCIKHRDEPNYASLGASGAILAVLFASIVYFPRQRLIILPLPVPIPAPLFALAYLAFSYYSSGRSAAGQTQDRINHDAHILGALTGVAFVLLTNPRQFQVLLHSFTG